MDNLIGYPLQQALKILEDKDKIINIKKVIGTNKKFNNLNNPYVIKQKICDDYITLFVSYY
ncbi:MAG: hypothetical protein PHE29_06650 [Tissierellia bacterium]|nr:hypothetical protein [Tissierellia bacterium]MDD4779553.1 hypothetical protein [Tissierellia bacterium]